jgi:ABC-type nitrate/sulfonate/bicarbonate transport system substrate-binding protein
MRLRGARGLAAFVAFPLSLPGSSSAAPTAAAPATPPGPPSVVTVGTPSGVGYPFYIGMERGYFREQGIDLQHDNFRAGAEMVPLLANGQLDVSQQALIPGTFNAVLRGLPLKAILDASHAGPDQRSHATLVRKELWDSGAVRTLADLVGRKVATTSLPGGLGIDVDRGLRPSGHRVGELDLTVLPFPDMPAALANGSVDAAIAVEPSLSSAVNQNSAVVLRWLSEDYPGHQVAVQVIGPSLVDRPDVAHRFVVAFLRGARDWNDAIQYGAGIDELAQLLTPYNRLDPGVNADLLRRHGFTSIDPDGRVDKESLAYDLGWYVEGGHLERPIDVDQFVDGRYADAAVAQLGPYVPPRRP